jgi:hypothetical protein
MLGQCSFCKIWKTEVPPDAASVMVMLPIESNVIDSLALFLFLVSAGEDSVEPLSSVFVFLCTLNMY